MKRISDIFPAGLKRFTNLFFTGFVANFLTAWLITGCFMIPYGSGIVFSAAFLHSMSTLSTGIIIAAVMLFMTAVNYRIGKAVTGAYALPYAVVLLGITINNIAQENVNDKMYFALVVFLAISVYYSYRCGCYTSADFTKKTTVIGIVVCSVIFTAILVTISALRYYSYASPNFDFGIFVNMYHNMRESLKPVSTCERDMLLSHFAVHVSPIYYVLLPLYWLFPSPYTLQISQAILVYSGIIPLCLLMRKFELERKTMLLISLVFLSYPALSSGCLYDFHENCFLVPLLLWMFYFFEKERTVLMFIFAVLTCFVKEDATVYVAIFAVYLILSRKEFKKGAALLAVALVIFGADCVILSLGGQGIMSGRYGELIYMDDGLLGVFKTVLANPGYFLSVLLQTSGDDSGKLVYLMNMLLPLALLPFFSKKISRYILIAPIFIIIMSFYSYQYNINYQYHFGITAFLFYITLLNISDIEQVRRPDIKLRSVLIFSVLASVLLYSIRVMPAFNREMGKALNCSDTFSQMDDILETIPQDAEVTCSTFLLPHIADRDVIYEVHYHDVNTVLTEYLVLDMRPGYAEGSSEFAEKYIALGYEPIAQYPDLISIYRLNNTN